MPKTPAAREPEPSLLDDLLTPADVARRLGINKRSIRALRDNHGFPAPVVVSEKIHRYRKSEVEAWIVAAAVRKKP